jgi:hypoxanthine phosphoribosyltransferase
MTEELTLLFSRKEIARTVARLAKEISSNYGNKKVVVIGILKGAFMFLADLVRLLTIPVEIDFMRIATYGSQKESSGEIKVMKEVETPLEGKDVLIIEDIVDTGLSLRFLRDYISAKNPASVKICTLLDKTSRRKIEVQVDYIGFKIEDGFVVGYGIDFDEKYRYLPEIFILN